MDTTATISTYHMSSNLQQYENKRTGFFTFVVEGLDELVRSDFALDEPTESDIIRDGQKVIELSVTSSGVPHFSTEVREIRRGNSVIKAAGVPSFEGIEIACDDFVGLDTKQTLMAWQALTYDVISDKGGRMHDWTDENGVLHRGYKKNCTLIEYTQDHEPIASWDLIGCWPSTVTEENFDKENDGNRKVSMTIQVDRAVLHKGL